MESHGRPGRTKAGSMRGYFNKGAKFLWMWLLGFASTLTVCAPSPMGLALAMPTAMASAPGVQLEWELASQMSARISVTIRGYWGGMVSQKTAPC